MSDPAVSVVIPTYNDRENVGSILFLEVTRS